MSFADAPSVTAQAAHVKTFNVDPDPAAQLCVVIPTPFDDDAETSSSTPVSAEGASVVELDSLSPVPAARVDDGGDCGGDCDGGDDPLSRSTSEPLAGMTLIDSLSLADGGGEGGGEAGGDSTAWELSSSSGDDDDDDDGETNVFSAIR